MKFKMKMKINDNVTFIRKNYLFFLKKQHGTIFSLHQVNNEIYVTVIFIDNNVQMGKVLKQTDVQLVKSTVKDSNFFILVLGAFFVVLFSGLIFLLKEEIVAEFNHRVQVNKLFIFIYIEN